MNIDAARKEAQILVDACAYGQLDSHAVPGAIGRLSSVLGIEFPDVPDEYWDDAPSVAVETTEVRQEWRDGNGNVDIDAVRSGNVDIRHQDDIHAALLDEVERLRAQVADAEGTVRDLDECVSEYSTGVQQSRELMHAILAAVDLPRPAAHIDWTLARRELIERRGRDVRIGLNGFLNGSAPFDVTLDWLRRTVEDYPVEYETAGGES